VKKKKGREILQKSSEVNIFSPAARLYNWKYFPLALSIFFIAVMLFLALTFHKVGGFDVETDFYASYAPEAKDFMMGKIVIDPFHGPLYPWALGLLAKIVGDLFTTGVAIAVLSASICLYLVFGIIKSVSSTDVAFLATLLTAINTFFIYYSYSAGTDMFFVALSLAGVFLLFREAEISRVELCLSAFLLGLAYLVRYNGLVFLISVPFIIMFGAVRIRRVNKYLAAAIWAGVFLLVIAPWSVYLEINRGSFFYNANYQNMAFELFGGGVANWDKFWFQHAKEYTSYWSVFSADPVLFVQTLLENVYSHFVGDLTELNDPFVGVLSALGVILFPFSHPTRRKVGLVVVFASFFCGLLPVFGTARFSLFLLPIYSFFASYVVKMALGRFRAKKNVIIQINLLAVAIVLLTFAGSCEYNSTKIINREAQDIQAHSDWFHQEFDDRYYNQKIAARKPHIAYLLNMRFYPFPMVDNYDSLIAVLRRDRVKFLYYGIYERGTRPQFSDDFDEDRNHPGLKTLCSWTKPDGRVVADLFEVTK
jgi:hypothetical protein